MSADEMFYGDAQPFNPSGIIMAIPTLYARMKAEHDHRGRDWRRVKREVRKAVDRARSEMPRPAISRTPLSFWLNRAV